jgi:hypothetical protein
MNRNRPNVPVTSRTAQYVTHEQSAAHEARNRRIGANVNSLVSRHRLNRRVRAIGLLGYWGEHHAAASLALLESMDNDRDYTVKLTHTRRLNRMNRALIQAVRDMSVRETYATEVCALLNPADSSDPTPSTSRTWKGLVNGTEVRVNTRGAYGKRGIKGAASRVTQRDARIPVALLKPLPHVVVGVATHPDADASDYAALLLTIRATPSLATVRVYADAGDAIGTVVAVADYDAVRETRKQTQVDIKSARVISDRAMHARIGMANPVAAG